MSHCLFVMCSSNHSGTVLQKEIDLKLPFVTENCSWKHTSTLEFESEM